MTENLRVTQYNNGDAIPTGLSDAEWENTTDGAYAIYPHGSISGLNSDAEVVEAYGKLYNWNAVDDARGLCPAGWHVPTDAEWTELVNYVVGQGYPNSNEINGAGNALKSCRQVVILMVANATLQSILAGIHTLLIQVLMSLVFLPFRAASERAMMASTMPATTASGGVVPRPMPRTRPGTWTSKTVVCTASPTIRGMASLSVVSGIID